MSKLNWSKNCWKSLTYSWKENSSISDFSATENAEAVEHLHSLSQLLHIVRENLTDIQERLEYLCGVHRRLLGLLGNCHNPGDEEPIADSFNYIKTSTSTLKRWAINYTERTGIRIHLLFNVSAQSDNRTNLDIAKITSKIAVTTQRDSSSMITYALFWSVVVFWSWTTGWPFFPWSSFLAPLFR